MVADDVLKVLHLGQVELEDAPILLDNLVTEVVDETLDEVQHLLGEQVSLLGASQIGNLGGLQILPHCIQLSLYELAPEQVSE